MLPPASYSRSNMVAESIIALLVALPRRIHIRPYLLFSLSPCLIADMASLFKKPVDKLLDEEGRPYTAFIPGRSGLIAIEAMAIQELLFPSSESPLIEPKESTRNQRVADGNIKYYIGNKAVRIAACCRDLIFAMC
jgi:hypothetical protein